MFHRRKNVYQQNRILQQNETLFKFDEHIPVSPSISQTETEIRRVLGTSADVVIRDFDIGAKKGQSIRGLLVSIEGLVDNSLISNAILEPVLKEPLNPQSRDWLWILEKIYVNNVSIETDLMCGILKVLNGNALLCLDGYASCLAIPVNGLELRPISEPPPEVVVRGSREGFIESSGTNLAMIRHRIQHPALRFHSVTIGEVTRTNVTVAYIEGIANPQLVNRVKQKLNQIQVDGLFDSGKIEQFIEDSPYTIFPTIGNTERPDRAGWLLLQGRIVLIIDGTPVALFVPYLFLDAFQNQEDYTSRPYYASFVRLLRVVAFFFSILLPSVFVAALNFHKSMIPSELITSIEEAREKVPFPLVMEVLLMTVMFEIVREAGIRMPRPIGQAVSIVGALILGQVSVQAGLIGAPTIIIVSLSAIASFLINPIVDAVAILRIVLIIPSSIFGFYGLLVVMLALITHMVGLTSLGVPYMSPFAPIHFGDWKDTFLRIPVHLKRKRQESVPNMRSIEIKHLPIDERKP